MSQIKAGQKMTRKQQTEAMAQAMQQGYQQATGQAISIVLAVCESYTGTAVPHTIVSEVLSQVNQGMLWENVKTLVAAKVKAHIDASVVAKLTGGDK